MKKMFFSTVIIFLMFVFLHGCGGGSVGQNTQTEQYSAWAEVKRKVEAEPEYIEGELLVRVKAGRGQRFMRLMSEDGAVVVDSTRATPDTEDVIYRIKLGGGMDVKKALLRYSTHPDVVKIQPNYIRRKADIYPSDPLFPEQWYLYRINAHRAWSITRCSPPATELVVAIIDTGVNYRHPDLWQNMWRNERNCTDGRDEDFNGYVDDCFGWDFFDNDNDPMDYNGHGTHVAGIVAATWNNQLGVSGICPGAKIMALKVFGAGDVASDFDIIRAINYAVSKNAKVINLSLGGYGGHDGDMTYDALSAARHAGVLVVASAGNDSNNNDIRPHYPASYRLDNIISVAASDREDKLARFSNYGTYSVHIAAPGVSILNTYNIYDYGDTLFDYFQNFNGTPVGSLPTGWTRGNVGNVPARWAVSAASGADGSPALEDSPGSTYDNNSITGVAYTSAIPYFKDSAFLLSLRVKFDLEHNHDFGCLISSGDMRRWRLDKCVSGSSGGIFLSPTILINNLIEAGRRHIGFAVLTDESIVRDGVLVDDVRIFIRRLMLAGSTYRDLNGTSMAAPVVTGAALMIWSTNPSLSYRDVRERILRSYDYSWHLEGKVSSPGVINLRRAVER